MFSKNAERNTAIIWFIVSVGSLVLAFVLACVFLVGHFTFGRFLPVMLLPVLAFLGFIIGFALYFNSKKLDAVISGKDVLAHWTYAPEEIAPHAAKEHKRQNNVKYISLAACVFMLFVALLFTYDKNGIDYGAVIENAILLLTTIIFIFSVLPAMGYGKSSMNEFYLARNGALFVGTFHLWRFFGTRLESVNFNKGKPATLEIIYSIRTEDGSRNMNLDIPIPKNKESEALNAVKKLTEK